LCRTGIFASLTQAIILRLRSEHLANLLLAQSLETQVLALNQTFEVREGFAELVEDVGRAMTVARSIVLWVHWVHNDEYRLALGSLRIERHFAEGVDSVELGVEAVGVEVEEAHQQARRSDVRALLQIKVVHVSHDQ